MRDIAVPDFAGFREAARALVAAGVRPEHVSFRDAHGVQTSLLATLEPAAAPLPAPSKHRAPRVSKRYLTLAELTSHHRSDDRFALLYRVLYRLVHEAPRLLQDAMNADVAELERRAREVQRDVHRMHAFVRFRETTLDGHARYVAWYEPQHRILPLAAPFFARRFAQMDWTILTPDASVRWDGSALVYGPGARRSQAPGEDALEALFRTYYKAAFNPARTNLPLLQRHIPAAFQRNMPELTVLSELATTGMIAGRAQPDVDAQELAATRVPDSRALDDLRTAAAACRACPLGERATQTVFGEGPARAKLCLVGEQPGDEEDARGHPFVGPAGKVLERALAEAGVSRTEVYLTNAVKHFNYRPVGKKRLHVRPAWQHVAACRPWLRAELEAVQPEVILCLGATAAQTFLGRRFTVTKNRGRVFETPWAPAFIVTYHPSAILRMPSEEARDEAYALLRADLTRAVAIARGERVAPDALPHLPDQTRS